MKMRIAGLDPSMAHFGIAIKDLDLETMQMELIDLVLIDTEKQSGKKVVRQSSDDLRRATEAHAAYHATLVGNNVQFVFSEVPSGGQSARAVYSFGIVVGLLASCPVPLIQVMPSETKLATVGTKTASKAEMIEWAAETYPSGPWIKRKSKGEMVLTNANEHLADACAVVYAGVKTDQFQQVRSMYLTAMGQTKAA
jgi:Holliday junction resolvasome RuvABC endonuclease subunit